MPPKTKFTREMILDAAFELARESGIESVNARSVASRLGCSTHPVMYCFATVDEIRREVYRRADEYQTAFIEDTHGGEPSILRIGAAYVRFAAEEKQLFRLLFQSDHFFEKRLSDMADDASVKPLVGMLAARYGIGEKEAKDEFTARFLMVHGMASMLANNSMIYDEEDVMRLLARQFSDR